MKKKAKTKIKIEFSKYVNIALIVLIIDQISKFLITSILSNKSIDFLFFHIKVIGNTGFAFGLNSGANIMNILLSLVFIGVIIRFLVTQKDNIVPKVQVALYLILGGALSNIIDRIIRGAVVDFIGIANFPVFNIADICIVIGWGLFVYYLIMFAVKREELKIKEKE